jgi:hypothetical protein
MLSSLTEALTKAAKTVPASTADPHVSAAFALGWQMAELYDPARRRQADAAAPGQASLESLKDPERREILVDQITAAIFKLKDPVANAGLMAIDTKALTASLGEDQPAQQREFVALHSKLLASLTAADFRLGKAYGLGRALAGVCLPRSDATALKEELTDERLANAIGWLDDLSSALPPHAAHSVAGSIHGWRGWAAKAPAADFANSQQAFFRQGELWRALLSGEKAGTEMLEMKNYLDAARTLTNQSRTLLWSVVARFPVVAALVLALIAGGVVLLLSGGGKGADLVGGAGSLLAAFGLTWKGLGGVLGQLAGKLEQPLWGAALDAAITDAINLLPGNKRDHRGRGKLAQEMTPPAPYEAAARALS